MVTSPNDAVQQLVEVSTEITTAVLLEGEQVLASTFGSDAGRADAVAGAVRRLAEAAGQSATRLGRGSWSQLQAALPAGSVFVVSDETRTVAATTGTKPTVGLIFYDLKSCLRDLREPDDAAPAAGDGDGTTAAAAAGESTTEMPVERDAEPETES